MGKSEQEPELEPYSRKPRAPELKPESCSRKAPQPCYFCDGSTSLVIETAADRSDGN